MAIVGLSDCNGKRLHAAAANLPEDAVVTTDLDEMLETAKPHTLVVTTRDDTHADIIVKALEARRPRFRYPVGPQARALLALHHKLPTSLVRSIMRRTIGLHRLKI